MEVTGYPSFVLYLIVIIGLPLAHFRPFKGFLVAVFLVTAADSLSFTYTRTSFLGPYFNVHDACLLIAIVSVITYCLRIKRKIIIPNVTKYIFGVLIIGFVQSYFAMGIDYHVLRSMRWAITLPIYFIIAATMVNDEKKVKSLLIVLFWGSIFSAIEHIIFVKSLIPIFMLHGSISAFRSIAFRSPGLWILLSCLVWMPNIKSLRKPLLVGGTILFAMSVLLNQTRSIWISSIVAVPTAFLAFKQKRIFKKALLTPLFMIIIFLGVMLGMHYTHPALKTQNIVIERLTTFIDEEIMYRTTITRQLALKRELTEWGEGTFIFGRGLSYYAPYYLDRIGKYRIAWGHLGHVTTLAQLGLIGLLVYSFFLPLNIVQASRRLWECKSHVIKFMGLIGGVCMISSLICFFMSDSFLTQHAVEGIIFGAVWRQANILQKQEAQESSIIPFQMPQETLKPLMGFLRYKG